MPYKYFTLFYEALTVKPDMNVVEYPPGIVLFSGEALEKGTWTAKDEHLAGYPSLSPFSTCLHRGRQPCWYLFDKKGVFYYICS